MTTRLLETIPVREVRSGRRAVLTREAYRASRTKIDFSPPGTIKPPMTLIDRSQLDPGVYLDDDRELCRAESWRDALEVILSDFPNPEELIMIIQAPGSGLRNREGTRVVSSRIIRLFCVSAVAD